MAKAAGVILIIAALLNAFASLGYLAGGAATSGLGALTDSAIEQGTNALGDAGSGTDQMAPDAQQRADLAAGAAELSNEIGNAAAMFTAMGIFLLVSCGLLIAGAVFLFKGKRAKFVLGVGVVAILAEVFGILLTAFGVMNIIGLVGGVLTILAVRSFKPGETPVAATA